jgi:hypothetical protein
MDDRTAHAQSGSDQIVRYDRAGKWWLESTVPLTPRRPLTLASAAHLARVWGPECVFFDLPGGGRFDKLVRSWENSDG